MNNTQETSGINSEHDFNAWCDYLQNSGLNDKEISLEIQKKILESPDLDKQSKVIFKDTCDYLYKLIDQNKPLEINLLKIYLENLCGHNIEKISIINTLILCGMCGINVAVKD